MINFTKIKREGEHPATTTQKWQTIQTPPIYNLNPINWRRIQKHFNEGIYNRTQTRLNPSPYGSR